MQRRKIDSPHGRAYYNPRLLQLPTSDIEYDSAVELLKHSASEPHLRTHYLHMYSGESGRKGTGVKISSQTVCPLSTVLELHLTGKHNADIHLLKPNPRSMTGLASTVMCYI